MIALRIIDEEGLDALSVRRLGVELGVNNKSLYHHFADKNAILTAATELALSDLAVPAGAKEAWGDWLLRTTQAYRDALVAHPALIPILRAPDRVGSGLAWFEETLNRLEGEGVPVPAVMALVETLDSFAVGNALCKTSARNASARVLDVETAYPGFARGLAQRTLGFDDQFRLGCRQLIQGVADRFDLDPRFKMTRAKVAR